MNRKRPYSPVKVKDVVLAHVLANYPAGCKLWVGIDVSKEFLLVALCWGREQFGRPWRVQQPEELPLLMELLKQLAQRYQLVVALEPTGTYGDPLRYALTQAGLDVRRVECKASHDHAETFDKVPSQHDAKDAMVVADLARDGRSTPWPLKLASEHESQMQCLVKVADGRQKILSTWVGNLEALLARHWPEACRILGLDSSTLLEALIEYGGPAGMANDPEAKEKLRRWGGSLLSGEKIAALVASAHGTAGVPASEAEREAIQSCAARTLQTLQELHQSHKELARFARNDPEMSLVLDVVGPATACVLWATLGSPSHYGNVRAYLKAAGLNLAERSSGKYTGQLRISKRGPATARRWLYMAAVRLVERPQAKRWYERKRQRDQDRHRPGRKGIGLIGLVALMRRLLGAMWHCTRKRQRLEVWRMFDPSRVRPAGRRQPVLA